MCCGDFLCAGKVVLYEGGDALLTREFYTLFLSCDATCPILWRITGGNDVLCNMRYVPLGSNL